MYHKITPNDIFCIHCSIPCLVIISQTSSCSEWEQIERQSAIVHRMEDHETLR